MTEPMPNTLISIFTYILAAVSGALGGCGVASYQALRGKRVAAAYFLAYATLGAVIGLAVLAAHVLVGVEPPPDDRVFALGLAAGVIGSAGLVAVNLSATYVLRWMGIEVQLTVRQSAAEERRR